MIFIKIMISNYLKIKKEKDNPKFFKMILMDGKYILLKNQKMLYINEKENYLNEILMYKMHVIIIICFFLNLFKNIL